MKKIRFNTNNFIRLAIILTLILALLTALEGCKSSQHSTKLSPEKLLVVLVFQDKGISVSPRGIDNIEDVINETGFPISELNRNIELLIETSQGAVYKVDNASSTLDILLSQWFQSNEPIKVYILPLKNKQAGD